MVVSLMDGDAAAALALAAFVDTPKTFALSFERKFTELFASIVTLPSVSDVSEPFVRGAAGPEQLEK